ncbi:zinc finger MYM-type protein 1-like [Papaver somniferum]|uniref:zinc finger MYM-type protein 1-like n=1 Tax=Papaver somniferum TaxID=3469 RepID=UPI000E6FC8B8|nr:zinc finger MYM-type protein 1-like [Papaver somniferum]
MGKPNTFHFTSVEKGQNLKNTSQHISTIIEVQSKETIQKNRLRFITLIECARWLAFQQCPFRGHDESKISKNRGSFIEMIRYSDTLNEKVKEVFLDNAPRNATYTSPTIQKEILNIISNKVKNEICEDIGNRKYCILVDECKNASNKEKMVLVLRFVDSNGYVQERFFDIQRVKNTCALTLKEGYDGANNMSGKWNGSQSLFLEDCKHAYYVHCFAHRLQLALVKTNENLGPVWKFFSMLTSIVNLVIGSSKRVADFQSSQEDDINERLDAGELETGRGGNQIGTLPQASDTRWSSHFNSVCSLIDKFDPTCTTIENISMSDANMTCGVGQAQSIFEDNCERKKFYVKKTSLVIN